MGKSAVRTNVGGIEYTDTIPAMVGGACAGLVAVIVLIVTAVVVYRKRKRKDIREQPTLYEADMDAVITLPSLPRFSQSESTSTVASASSKLSGESYLATGGSFRRLRLVPAADTKGVPTSTRGLTVIPGSYTGYHSMPELRVPHHTTSGEAMGTSYLQLSDGYQNYLDDIQTEWQDPYVINTTRIGKPGHGRSDTSCVHWTPNAGYTRVVGHKQRVNKRGKYVGKTSSSYTDHPKLVKSEHVKRETKSEGSFVQWTQNEGYTRVGNRKQGAIAKRRGKDTGKETSGNIAHPYTTDVAQLPKPASTRSDGNSEQWTQNLGYKPVRNDQLTVNKQGQKHKTFWKTSPRQSYKCIHQGGGIFE